MPSPSPLVYWDAFGFAEAGGIRRYSEQLEAGLVLEGCRPLRLTRTGQTPTAPAARLRQKFTASKLLWPDLAFQQALGHAGGKPFVFHGLANCNLPFFLKKTPPHARFVLTLHDLIPLLPGSGVSWAYQAQFRALLPRALERATQILCVSAWTREQLLERYPSVASKSVVLVHGLSLPEVCRPVEPQLEDEKVRLLCVTRSEPYKRLPWLLAMIAALPANFELHLVCDARGLALVRQTAAAELAQAKIRLYSGLSEFALQQLYAQAHLYVQPSLYEGYCLPAFEALAQHTPVLYQKGHALDGLLAETVARGVEVGAGLDAWLAEVRALSGFKTKPQFKSAVEAFLQAQPSWQETARAVKEVYNTSICDSEGQAWATRRP